MTNVCCRTGFGTSAAIKEGAENFDPSQSTVTLSQSHSFDLQLLVQHLLKYQSFNLGQLKRQNEENQTENAFRELELEKSKRMLLVNSYSNRKKLLPPKPEQLEAFCEGIREIIRNHADARKDMYSVSSPLLQATS